MNAYKYHAQRQAEEFARQILPVPAGYPLKTGLPEEFRDHFNRLCALARKIYLDMAERPEAYGLMLLDIQETDHNLARDSYRTIHRFVDTLNALFLHGDVQNHCLRVNAADFRAAIKKTPPVPKYGLVLERLRHFGFAISDFDGTAIDKKAEAFTVEYPDDPEIIDTVKTYCDCWRELDQFRRNRVQARNPLIKLSPQEFHHHFYRFDYKITADLEKIPMMTWINEEADYQGYDEQLKQFQEAFYAGLMQHKGLRYDGEYHYKGKRIARIAATGYSALGEPRFMLSLKLKNMDQYIGFVQALPEGIKKPFTKNSCGYCGFQGSTKEHCKFRVHWTLEGMKHTGCAFWCFHFTDFALDLAPVYLNLLALEYGF